jgi:hypothetical protein
MVVDARRRARVARKIEPGTTVHHAGLCIGFFIVAMLLIFVKPITPIRTGPFPNVTGHIVQFVFVGGETAYRCCFLLIPWTAAFAAIGVIVIWFVTNDSDIKNYYRF